MSFEPYSLYVHVPFCAKRCPYCDFNTYVQDKIPEQRYFNALLDELELRLEQPGWQGRRLKSLYFGGGTPSLISPVTLKDFISYLSRNLGFEDQIEITLEANPGTVDLRYLCELREAGINRLSFGFQSFHNRILKILGRDHTVEAALEAYAFARNAGFRNVSFDLMFGVPEQQMLDLEHDLSAALELAPQHISIYGLTIEKGTPFYQHQASGTLILPDEDRCAEMLEKIRGTLTAAGYSHYEISNFAKPGAQSQHNLSYWSGDDYLGLGAGAHSYSQESSEDGYFLAARRWSSYALPEQYMKSVEGGSLPQAWQESILLEDAIFEFFFLGLRKLEGLDLSLFKQRFGFEYTDIFPALVDVLSTGGLLERENQIIRLSEQGFMIADSVISHFSEPEVRPVWLNKSAPRDLTQGSGNTEFFLKQTQLQGIHPRNQHP